MRKLIEKKELGDVVCDNPNCDYSIKHSSDEIELISYIDMPCPKCGQNLLTKEDYIQYIKLVRLVDWINKYFSWMTLFQKK